MNASWANRQNLTGRLSQIRVARGCSPRRGDVSEIVAFAEGGTATLVDLKAYEMNSIWPNK